VRSMPSSAEAAGRSDLLCECHRDMFLRTSIFNHDFHQEKLGGNKGCGKCHGESGFKSAAEAKPCTECHTAMAPQGSRVAIRTKGPDRLKFAAGYVDAMHGLCISLP